MPEEHLPVDSYGADEGDSDWTKVGSTPYLDARDEPTNYVHHNVNLKWLGYFGFQDSAVGAGTINSVHLKVYVKSPTTYLGRFTFEIFDGTDWHDLGYHTPSTQEFEEIDIDVSTYLDTWAKINNAKLRMKLTWLNKVKTYYCDGYSAVDIEWTKIGDSPYLSNDASEIRTSGSGDFESEFTFLDMESAIEILYMSFNMMCKQDGGGNDGYVTYLYDGSSWIEYAEIVPQSTFTVETIVVTTDFDTPTKASALKLKVEKITHQAGQTVNLQRCYFNVTETCKMSVDEAKLVVDYPVAQAPKIRMDGLVTISHV